MCSSMFFYSQQSVVVSLFADCSSHACLLLFRWLQVYSVMQWQSIFVVVLIIIFQFTWHHLQSLRGTVPSFKLSATVSQAFSVAAAKVWNALPDSNSITELFLKKIFIQCSFCFKHFSWRCGSLDYLDHLKTLVDSPLNPYGSFCTAVSEHDWVRSKFCCK